MNNEQDDGKVTPYSFRNFVRRMNNAAVRIRYRNQQLQEIGERMEELSELSAEKRPDKRKMENGIETLKAKIGDFVNQEKVIIVKQKNEQNEIDELKRRLAMMEERIEGLGNLHAVVADTHYKRIVELQKTLQNAESERGRADKNRAEPRAYPEEKQRVKHHPKLVISTLRKLGAKKKREQIRNIQMMIGEAEKTHSELRKKGIPKRHLEKLKKTIVLHKKRLKELKKYP